MASSTGPHLRRPSLHYGPTCEGTSGSPLDPRCAVPVPAPSRTTRRTPGFGPNQAGAFPGCITLLGTRGTLAVATSTFATRSLRRWQGCRKRTSWLSAKPANPEEEKSSKAVEERISVPTGWQDLDGCAVLFPQKSTDCKELRGLVHFLGGAFVGASPRLFYQTFLEALCDEGHVVIIATPYKLTFDYDVTGDAAVEAFEATRQELISRGWINSAEQSVFAVGHSCGALLHSLLAARRGYAGCVLMSFNNRPVSEAIPVELPGPPRNVGLREAVSGGIERSLAEEQLERGLRGAAAAVEVAAGVLRRGAAASETPRSSERLAREWAPVFGQLGPLLGGVVRTGQRDFSISQEEVAERLSGSYVAPRTLLVQFANDLTDETPRLADILAGSSTGALDVQQLRLPGGHTAPLDYPGLGRGRRSRVGRIAKVVGEFLQGADLSAAAPQPKLPELKARLLSLTAGTNRGFSLVAPRRRQEILDCVEEIEALASPPPLGTEALPEALFGKWRLVWSTSPDVLLLAALPLLDCGEIRQDIPFGQDCGPGRPLEVLNSVELGPRGLGLLGALPGLSRAATVKAEVRALAEPLEGGTVLSIRFEDSTLRSGFPGLPPLRLPTLPSASITAAASGIKLLTSFLDSELRFARSTLGDVFVLVRAD